MLNSTWKRITGSLAVAAALVVGSATAASAAVPAAAPTAVSTAAAPAVSTDAATAASSGAGATGQYEYVCVYTDGSSVSLPAGSVADCTGASYLQTYLDGVQLESVALTSAGDPATASPQCIIAVAGSVIVGLIPGGARIVYFAMDVADVFNYNPCQ
ncbi:hypothetical protein [Microbacterium sp. P04]|uniref:hypothetical protein n=1 Tax=Microbacterium sp. P04 TaxID=3366947 RepID=UPI003745D7DE